jgi:hypothetical protein
VEGGGSGIENEPVLSTNACGHGAQQVGRCLGDGAAAVADEVMMLGDRQVEHRGARADLDAGDDAEIGEPLEGAIHGRLVEVGVVGPHRVDDVGDAVTRPPSRRSRSRMSSSVSSTRASLTNTAYDSYREPFPVASDSH